MRIFGFATPNGLLLGKTDRAVLGYALPSGGFALEERPLSLPPVPFRLPFLRGLYAVYATFRDYAWAMGRGMPEGPMNPLEAVLAVFLNLLLLPLPLLFLFVFPLYLAGSLFSRSEEPFLYYLVYELSSLAFALLFLRLMTLPAPFRPMLRYHGAEHKVAWVLEKGLPLTLEEARRQSIYHPRCGTAFLLLTALLAVVFYGLLLPLSDGVPPHTFLLLKLLLLPVLVALSYEVHHLVERWPLLALPGLLLQRLTVEEPKEEELRLALLVAEKLLGEGQTPSPLRALPASPAPGGPGTSGS